MRIGPLLFHFLGISAKRSPLDSHIQGEEPAIMGRELVHARRGKLAYTRKWGGQGQTLDLLVKIGMTYHLGKSPFSQELVLGLFSLNSRMAQVST